MKRHGPIPICLTLLSLLLTPFITQQTMTQTRQVDLTEMVGAAGMIFVGQVTEVRAGLDEQGEIATWTTFRIEQPLRGVLPGSTTIKQYGGAAAEGTVMVAHMRYFTEGERALVMLYPPSELGFTSPIGMSQGAWRVDESGNMLGFSPDLLKGLETVAIGYDAVPTAEGTVPLDGVIRLIGMIARSGRQ